MSKRRAMNPEDALRECARRIIGSDCTYCIKSEAVRLRARLVHPEAWAKAIPTRTPETP